jgi:hypothetical protein
MLADQPERVARFANAIVYFNSNEDLSPYYLCDAFDWTGIKQLVDIGGSAGSTAVALAARLPELRMGIQEYQVLEEEARRSILLELRDRVTFMAHNFFENQPVHDADAYHFRWVFHDWPDKYCSMLLRALSPALSTGARIIISDFVMAESGTTSWYREGLVRYVTIRSICRDQATYARPGFRSCHDETVQCQGAGAEGLGQTVRRS